VDDDQDFLTDAKLLLETDFVCECASSVQQAMAMLNENSYDAMLLDIHFGDGHTKGFELLRSMRRERRMLPVIMVSEDEKPITVFEASQSGAQGYVRKSFKSDELIPALKNLIGRKQSIPVDNDASLCDQDSWILAGKSDAAERLRVKLTAYAEQTEQLLIAGPEGSLKSSFACMIHQRSNLQSKSFISLKHEQIREYFEDSAESGGLLHPDSRSRALAARLTTGTVLIREIAQIDQNSQIALTKYLRSSMAKQHGQTIRESAEPRIIATTSTDLSRQVRDNRFSEELYGLLTKNEFIIRPLVTRHKDISHIVEQYSWLLARQMNRSYRAYTDDAMKCLQKYDWRRNLSELAEAVQYAFLQADSELITADDLPPHIRYYPRNIKYKEWKRFAEEQHQSWFWLMLKSRVGESFSLLSRHCGISREGIRKCLNRSDVQKYWNGQV
jgi:DNA-binding NtrC family response regulator